jgi:membrane associated rhomboid family serine protease
MARPVTVMRQLPLTTGLLALVLLMSVVTRGLWQPLGTRPLGSSMAYGLPSFEDGAWWTLVTGSFLALEPVRYLPILVGLALFGGFAEWRLGTGRAGVALVSCQVVAVLAAAALLWASRDHGYLWTTSLADDRDAGPSAAFLGAVAASRAGCSSARCSRAAHRGSAPGASPGVTTGCSPAGSSSWRPWKP